MKNFVLLLAALGLAFGARLEKLPLPAGMGIWFEPNRGQVGGRTEWTSRAAGEGGGGGGAGRVLQLLCGET